MWARCLAYGGEFWETSWRYFFTSDRQHLLDSTPARFTVDLVFKFVRLMAVGYVADCQRSMLPPQCMEGGREGQKRERSN